MKMTSALYGLFNRLIKAAVSIAIGIFIMFTPFCSIAEASGVVMSGNYIDDTVLVVHDLKETIALSPETEKLSDKEDQAVQLITAYISRYRNRSQINKSLSYTTMQTALNAMAGHYKTFKNRPLPDQLKNRLNEQLSKAEELAINES